MNKQIDFIGIGCPKSGTTKLAALLRDHPEICFSEPKSLRYFNRKNSYYQKFENPIFDRGLDEYFIHFKHRKNEKICGEFTTVYLYEEEAAQMIKKTLPDVKLIVCFRNPIDRVVSHFNWLTHFLQVEQRPFSQLIREEPELIDKSLYAKHLKPYQEIFNPENIHVVFLEQFVKAPEKVLSQLYKFLHVDDQFIPESLYDKVNSKRVTRSVGLSKLYGRFVEVMVNNGYSTVIEKLRNTPLRKVYQKINSKNLPKEVVLQSDDISYMNQHFHNDIIELEKMLDIDLGFWKRKYS